MLRLLLASVVLASPPSSIFYPLSASASSSASAPDATFDLQAHIDARLAAGDTTIVIPPGVHRVAPRDRQHLLLRGLRDITIVADDAELVCTETTRAITIEDCHNLTLRGLTIDYDPLPFTQARIVAISADTARLDVELIEGYPAPSTAPGSVEIFDPATRELRGRITYFNTRCEPTGPRTATLHRGNPDRSLATARVGDIAVIKSVHAPGGSIPHALMATDSTGLVFENVTLYSGVTFGFFENHCDGSRYLGCRVVRRPADTDRAPRALPRLRSVNADAFHSKNARRGPRYERCTALHNGDDSIAINGDFHFVTESEGDTLRVLAKHDMTMRVGDAVQLFTYDGRRLDDHTIVAIAPDASATEAERRLIAAQQMNDRLQQVAMKKGFVVTLDAPVAVPPGTLIASADSIGSGFVIRDCLLGHNRARGILVKAGRGEIVGNTLERVTLTSILVSPEFWWLEAGLADDLLIAENTIRDARGIGISLVAHGGDGSLAGPGAFRNITVRDNSVSGGPAPALLLTSIRGLTETGNTVSTDPAKQLHSWEIRRWDHAGIHPVTRLNNE